MLSIFSLIIYLIGSVQSSWVLVDFYWHRDDYTQQYCHFIDQGITQCRASCYLDDLMDDQQNETSGTKIILIQKIQVVEIASEEYIDTTAHYLFYKQANRYIADYYQFDFHQLIFHPPKA